jgi:hypothetical protein
MNKGKPFSSVQIHVIQLLNLAVFAAAGLYIILYLVIVCLRIHYPFELEWIEGGMVDEVQRLLHGQALYVAPSIRYVPYLYPPFYFYLSAASALIFGSGMFPLRLVSFLASLVSFAVIFETVRKETRNAWAAIIATGLFAAAYRVTGAWLDIARVDSLFLALWLLFIYFIRGKGSYPRAVIAGFLAGLSYLTKQTALIACVPILAYLLWRNWKYALCSLAAAGLTVGITTLAFNWSSAGWYSYYTFTLLSQQTEWIPVEFLSFWKDDLLIHLPIAIPFALFFLIRRPEHGWQNLMPWWAILLGGLAGSFLTRVKVGGYDNVLLPAYAVLSMLFGLGLEDLLRLARQSDLQNRSRWEGWVLFTCLIQLVILFYNPLAQLPTAADRQDGDQLVRLLASVNGPVFLADHGYLPTLAGKEPYAQESAIWDVLRGSQQTEGKALLSQDLGQAIHQQTFDMVILDSDLDLNWCCAQIGETYTRVGEVFQDSSGFYPVTGDQYRPTYIYLADRLMTNQKNGPNPPTSSK